MNSRSLSVWSSQKVLVCKLGKDRREDDNIDKSLSKLTVVWNDAQTLTICEKEHKSFPSYSHWDCQGVYSPIATPHWGQLQLNACNLPRRPSRQSSTGVWIWMLCQCLELDGQGGGWYWTSLGGLLTTSAVESIQCTFYKMYVYRRHWGARTKGGGDAKYDWRKPSRSEWSPPRDCRQKLSLGLAQGRRTGPYPWESHSCSHLKRCTVSCWG